MYGHARARAHTHWYLVVWNFINCSKLFQLHQAIHVYVYMWHTHKYYTCNEISRHYLCISRIHITCSISQESHNLNFRCVCLYIDTVINIGDERTEMYNWYSPCGTNEDKQNQDWVFHGSCRLYSSSSRNISNPRFLWVRSRYVYHVLRFYFANFMYIY
jgi:hypothetical protein